MNYNKCGRGTVSVSDKINCSNKINCTYPDCTFPRSADEHEMETFGAIEIEPDHIQYCNTPDACSFPDCKCVPMSDVDPNGLDQHAKGAKLDAGKIKPAMVLTGFAHAFWEVSKVGTLGAEKYTEFGFLEVKDGEKRYADAHMRHFLKKAMEGDADIELTELAKKFNIEPDKEVLHLACEAWNKLAELEFKIRSMKGKI